MFVTEKSPGEVALPSMGRIRGPDAMTKARDRFRVKHPVLHELDMEGNEIHRTVQWPR